MTFSRGELDRLEGAFYLAQWALDGESIMAKPRVFLSSTFYDLRYIRNDLEQFITSLGYEPVMSERGHIPYGRTGTLESYCHREISNCDILIHIVGSKFGTQSKEGDCSISQAELKTAHELHRQIYVFIERPVHTEYKTWTKNIAFSDFRPQYVDDIRIYQFIHELYSLPANNIINDFDSVHDIINYLKEQWAGLFQRFLQEESRKDDYKLSANLKATADTLAKIVEYTTRERDETIKNVLVYSHPLFNQLANAARIRIRIFFCNYEEMDTLLSTFGYSLITESGGLENGQTTYHYQRQSTAKLTDVFIVQDVFDDDGNLKPIESNEWTRDFVSVEMKDFPRPPPDDDIPF